MSSTARSIQTASSVQDVVDAVRQAAADGTTISASRAADGDGQQLDLSALNQVVDYPARDMTVTVEAGLTLQALTDLLAEEGQHLPVDIGDPEMSVGAFVAADLAGPRQYGYGTLRDYVIGLEAVDGQGRVFHAGGRVVKNVAGYDLCRLMTGSRGALGILTQLTFKLKPVPDQLSLHVWQFSDQESVAAALERLNLSSTRPVIMDLEVHTTDCWRLLTGVEGPASVCDWQLEQLRQELQTADQTEEAVGDSAAALDYCRQAAARHLSADTLATVRTLPSRVPSLCQMMVQSGGKVDSHAGSGIILFSGLDAQELPDSLTNQLQTHLSDHGGHLVLPATGHGLSGSVGSLTTGLVSAFDPGHVFG